MILYFERVLDLRYPNVQDLYCFLTKFHLLVEISHLYESVRDARFCTLREYRIWDTQMYKICTVFSSNSTSLSRFPICTRMYEMQDFFYFERVQDLKYPNVRDLYCSNEWNHGEKIVRVWTRIRELIESDRGIEKCSSVNEDWISPRYENVYRILRLLSPPPLLIFWTLAFYSLS